MRVYYCDIFGKNHKYGVILLLLVLLMSSMEVRARVTTVISSTTIDTSNPTMTRTITFFTTIVIPDNTATITSPLPTSTNGVTGIPAAATGGGSPNEGGLSVGAIVAIAVVAGIIFLAVAMYLYIRWKGNHHHASNGKRYKRNHQQIMDRFNFSNLATVEQGNSRNVFQPPTPLQQHGKPLQSYSNGNSNSNSNATNITNLKSNGRGNSDYPADSIYHDSEFLPDIEDSSI